MILEQLEKMYFWLNHHASDFFIHKREHILHLDCFKEKFNLQIKWSFYSVLWSQGPISPYSNDMKKKYTYNVYIIIMYISLLWRTFFAVFFSFWDYWLYSYVCMSLCYVPSNTMQCTINEYVSTYHKHITDWGLILLLVTIAHHIVEYRVDMIHS